MTDLIPEVTIAPGSETFTTDGTPEVPASGSGAVEAARADVASATTIAQLRARTLVLFDLLAGDS